MRRVPGACPWLRCGASLRSLRQCDGDVLTMLRGDGEDSHRQGTLTPGADCDRPLAPRPDRMAEGLRAVFGGTRSRRCLAASASQRARQAARTRCPQRSPANIAEGHGRYARGDFLRFLHIAHGSLTEVDTHLRIIGARGYAAPADVEATLALTAEVGRLLGGLMRALRATPATPRRPPTPAPPPTCGSAAPSSPWPRPSGR